MKSLITIITATASVLALNSCMESTLYSAKGKPVETVKRMDPAFWTGAGNLARDYAVSRTSSK